MAVHNGEIDDSVWEQLAADQAVLAISASEGCRERLPDPPGCRPVGRYKAASQPAAALIGSCGRWGLTQEQGLVV